MDPRVTDLLHKMTLEEKCSMLSGQDFWHTQAIERLGIESVMLSDGPHGLRRQSDEGDHLGLNESLPATAFPTGAGLGASWDRDLVYEVGSLIGQEARAQNVSVVLGPACNIKRSPLCGRNFEYLAEDPFLSSQIAKHHITGVQSQGVGTSIKHFCANNQESRRMTVDTIVDERTLREIYLASFETAIREARPATVMCSYNKVNGTYLSDNKSLLTDILRGDWGYQGLVVSDWGAVNDRISGVKAGMDLEMPASGGVNDQKVKAAVLDGRLTEADIDQVVARILSLVFDELDINKAQDHFDIESHHARAREIAGQCMVLLKNDGPVLPLRRDQDLVVIGMFAASPRFQGGGSSHINPTRLTKAMDEISSINPKASYYPGFPIDSDDIDQDHMAEAIQAARDAGTAVVFAGLPDHYESEGYDRQHMRIPPNQIALIEAVSAACPNVVVVLANGSPVEMPWAGKAASILEGYLPGQAGGGAIADILFGKVNPCGKLAETFPIQLEDNPSFLNYPGYRDRVEYREGIYVGYRYYDQKKMGVLFPFGHGLSYTSFEYSDLKASQAILGENDTLSVDVTIRNTGDVAGSEIIQMYLSYPGTGIIRAPQELKGFEKVHLQPDESRTVQIRLDHRSFAYYDVDAGDFLVESGPVEIRVGSSSRDIRLTTRIVLQADRLPPVTFSLNSSRMDLLGHPVAAAIAKPFFDKIASFNDVIGEQDQATSDSGEEESPFDAMMEEMMAHLPLRSLILFSGGAICEEHLQQLIDQCNKAAGKEVSIKGSDRCTSLIDTAMM